MGALRLIRIDYVPAGTWCHSGCHHELEMAHVVLDEEGSELFYGSKCITDIFPAAELKKMKASVPDLTLRGGSAASGGGKIGRLATGGEPRDDLQKRAAEYLWLRLDKVAALCPDRAATLRWAPLCEKFEQLKTTGRLSDSDAEMVLNTEKGERTPPEFRRLNLMDVYSAACQLERKLKKKPNDFLDGLLLQLKAKLRLSSSQMDKAKIDLPATAFGWYVPSVKS
jgi:hypothetical protein